MTLRRRVRNTRASARAASSGPAPSEKPRGTTSAARAGAPGPSAGLVGAWLGGMAIGSGVSLVNLPWVGVAMAVAALALTLWSASLERRPVAVPTEYV